MNTIDDHAARWVAETTGVAVSTADRLVGGMSSAAHLCRLADGRGVVVKHVRDAAWLQREPDMITHEAHTLELLAATELPVPRHLASDPSQGLLLMSYLPGRMRVDPAGLRNGAASIAALASRIAAVPLPLGHRLPWWRSWAPDRLVPPDWGDTALWMEGIDTFRATVSPAAETPVLLHRDLHPLNLLWDEDTIVGIVDWLNACIGHPHAELSHCRWNLAVAAGPDAADVFLEQYVDATDSSPYSYWWDLSTLMGLLPGPIGAWGYHAVGRTDLTDEIVVVRTEAFLRSALSRL